MKTTNWYVITGGPGSGKTTTIELLKARGYLTTIEHARHYIDTQLKLGRTIAEIKKDTATFQRAVLEMQLAEESDLDPMTVVFLDRALPDTLAYYRFFEMEENAIQRTLQDVSYKKIFILEPLPLVNDYARHENTDEQHNLHRLITDVYQSLPFPIVSVPVLPPEQRINFILEQL